MQYCPQCRDEFQDWVKTCPDCQVALVTELPVPPSPTIGSSHGRKPAKASDPLVLLATAPNKLVADMWVGILEDKGIRCLVKTHPGYSIGYPPVSLIQPSIMQFEVYVLQTDAERARETLDGIPDDRGTP